MMSHKKVALTMILFVALALTSFLTQALDIHQLRQLAVKNNVTCVLVFGDSSVDPGNNNHLATTFKGNFPPYGKNFFNGRPTGRFSDGKLATDFIAESIGNTTSTIPAFLDPNLKKEELLYGVSFASAASGYDDLTANLTNVLPVSKQLKYLLHYKIHLKQLIGRQNAEEYVKNAIFILSMGTNDFIQNYFVEPVRSKQFTLEQYQNYLISCMLRDIKMMHRLGARRLVVVGVPPLGCMPLVKTIMAETKCVDNFNKAIFSFNSKINEQMATLRATLGLKCAFVDIYGVMESAINNPKRYGFTEVSKGCCGTGTIEYGDTCKGMPTCEDPTKYVFWDAVHPTEAMYKIIAYEAVKSLDTLFL